MAYAYRTQPEFPSESHLHALSNNIGYEIQEVAARLGITNAEVEQIQSDHRIIRDQNFHILLKWRDRSSLDAKDRSKQLQECMTRVGREPLSQMVNTFYQEYTDAVEKYGDRDTTYPKTDAVEKYGDRDTTYPKTDISNVSRFGELLGSGATGKVYKYYDSHNRELAAKKILIDSKNPKISKEIKAFRSEIQLLKNLQHERIVQYIGSQEGPDFYIFLEYMPGGSIRHQISAHGALSEKVTQKYTKQILEGLTYLHQRNVIHRDIKCGNILKDNSDNVKLADFGVSKKMQTICSSNAKTFVGTVYWMSPEIITGKVYGRKVDIWSVGCTIVEMLTKNPPWSQLEVHAAMFKIGTGEKPMYELPQNSSSSCEDFIKSCLQTNPENRPSAESLMSHLFINSEQIG